MSKIMSAKEAVELIKDGDCIGINSFIVISNPEGLHSALAERFNKTGHPKNLRLFCAAAWGGWDKERFAEKYVSAGAVSEVIAGHFGTMPETTRLALSGEIEAYNLPLGVLSHSIRAAASGQNGIFSKVGLGTYVDPRIDTPALNDKSKKELVKLVNIEGEEYLYYKAPRFDIVLLKGTTADPNGNITFEKEYLTVDALALAQATKANGGKVIMQVENISKTPSNPRDVVVPGALVDAIVLCDREEPYNPALSGEMPVPPSQMESELGKLTVARQHTDDASEIIAQRAAKELEKGQIINLGIGIPELVGKCAARMGLLQDITLTVEPGGIGGMPAPGMAFGATIGADMICGMASQFDFYDGGGLDICFMGGLEVDKHGNVNAHKRPGSYAGIGGFMNITSATKTVVFCLTFTAKGLEVCKKGDGVEIISEGSIPKIKSKVDAISFSAKMAMERGQRVLYVTERCVFELTPNGLKIKEVFDGIDIEKDIKAHLDFEL